MKPNNSYGKKRVSGKRSALEERVAKGLDRKGVEYEYETVVLVYESPPIPAKSRKYTPDYIILKSDNTPLFLEVKGRMDKKTRDKMIWVKEHNPEADIRFIFQRDNPLSPGAKMKYSGWAVRHGFPYCISPNGTVPEEWLSE